MSETPTKDPENTLLMDLEHGQVVIALRPDLAPNHVARIKELARDGFYDGIVFHRVIEGFMAQGGDPTGTGMSGSGTNLKRLLARQGPRRGLCDHKWALTTSSGREKPAFGGPNQSTVVVAKLARCPASRRALRLAG